MKERKKWFAIMNERLVEKCKLLNEIGEKNEEIIHYEKELNIFQEGNLNMFNNIKKMNDELEKRGKLIRDLK